MTSTNVRMFIYGMPNFGKRFALKTCRKTSTILLLHSQKTTVAFRGYTDLHSEHVQYQINVVIV